MVVKTERPQIYSQFYQTPFGSKLILGERQGELVFCDWVAEGYPFGKNASKVLSRTKCKLLFQESPFLKEVKENLDEYFAWGRRSFLFPIRLEGSDFQKKVWTELQKIPFGKKISYLTVAELIGMKKGVRAVAGAIGRNPISIIVPCHRVVGSNGSLTGYAGGLKAKQWLLKFETGS